MDPWLIHSDGAATDQLVEPLEQGNKVLSGRFQDVATKRAELVEEHNVQDSHHLPRANALKAMLTGWPLLV